MFRARALILLTVAACWAPAAQAAVLEVADDGSVKVLSDSPNADWSSGELEAEPAIPHSAITLAGGDALPPAYARAVEEIARANGISPLLLEAVVWQESRWNPGAVSRAGAIGLAQLMPATATELGVNPRDPIQNLSGGARYLRQQLDRFGGDLEKALAAYNAGPGRVMRAGRVPSIPETQAYVRAIVARLASRTVIQGGGR